jgi:hypothetical protein
MKIEAKMLVAGTKPKPDWIGKNSTLKVEFSAAENHNINRGTRDNPDWQTLSTSWFNVEAWGDVAKEILDSGLDVGGAFSMAGVHKIDKVQKENEKPKYYPKYKILDYSKYERDED